MLQKTITLPEHQVVLHMSQGNVVQLPAQFSIQYFPREDCGENCAPVKILVSIGRNDWREFSLTIKQTKQVLYFLRRAVTRRTTIPHSNSDNEIQ